MMFALVCASWDSVNGVAPSFGILCPKPNPPLVSFEFFGLAAASVGNEFPLCVGIFRSTCREIDSANAQRGSVKSQVIRMVAINSVQVKSGPGQWHHIILGALADDAFNLPG